MDDSLKGKEQTIQRLKELIRTLEGEREVSPDCERIESCEIETVLPGRHIETPFGTCYEVRLELDLGTFQGKYRLREIFDAPISLQAECLKDDRILDLDPRHALYLDTETTGLSAAAGDFAFMIGLGHFAESGFTVIQLFTRDHGEEPSALYELCRIAKEFTHLVTFNGRGFDVPLLDTRLAIHRFDKRLAEMPHIDILTPARRLWRYGDEGCSLGALEREVLGFGRVGDVPGFEIPALYGQYLRDRDARRLKGVFEHNALDVISMAPLQARIAALLAANPGDDVSAQESYALGRYHQTYRRMEMARQWFELARGRLTDDDLETDNSLRYARLLKKENLYEEAANIWREIVDIGPEFIDPYRELAIYLEHRTLEYQQALAVIDRALEKVVFTTFEKKQKWLHRRARVERKLNAPMP